MFFLPMNRRKLLADARLLGRWGERRSERFLKNRGLKTIARNFNCKLGEIDLIVTNTDGMIVFVEVKTRRDEDYAQAKDAVNYKKRLKLGRLAKFFLKTYKIKDKPFRFDIVAVVLGKKGPARIRHYENAFIPPRF